MPKSMRIADAIINWMAGINDCVFTLVGGYSMHLNDALGRSGLRYICMHHEQAAAIAAEGYARATGRAGLCLITGGPGGTNTITGLFNSYVDSIPMVFVSGQVKTDVLKRNCCPVPRQLGDQEVDIIPIVKSLTKYATTITNPHQVSDTLREAEFMAHFERPGPVWIDVPLDIQVLEMPTRDTFKGLKYDPCSTVYPINILPIKGKIAQSERPVIIVGQGVRAAHAKPYLDRLRSVTNIPVLPAFHALDLVVPRYAGPFGTIGTRAANTILQKADLILVLGCSMNMRHTGYEWDKIGKKAYKIKVDIDPSELRKPNFIPDAAILSDVGLFLNELYRVGIQKTSQEWLSFCSECVRIDDEEMPLLPDRADYVNMYRVIEKLNNILEIGDQVISSNGLASVATGQMLRLPEKGRFMVSSGAAPMGYGLPMAIGASIANPNVRTYCIEGDGSIMLNIQELQTISHHKLPITILLFNNQGYGSIRSTQNRYFDGFYVGSDKKSGISFPNFRDIAIGCKIDYRKVTNHNDLELLFAGLNNGINGPCFCELNIDPGGDIMPRGITCLSL